MSKKANEHLLPPIEMSGQPASGQSPSVQSAETLRCEQDKDELLENNNRLLAILDAIPDLLFEVGMDGRIHNYHSPRTDLLAAPPEVFLGKKFSDVLPPDVTDVLTSAILEAHEKGCSIGKQYELQLAHGKFSFELAASRKPVNPGQESRFIFLVRDITQRKKQTDELKLFKQRYDLATSIGKVGIWDWNPVTGSIHWSDEFFRILRLEPGAVQPSHALFFKMVHPDDKAFLSDAVHEAMREHKRYRVDCRVIAGDGEERICRIAGEVEYSEAGEPKQMLGTFLDITEQIKAERVSKLYNVVIDSAMDGFWMADMAGNLRLARLMQKCPAMRWMSC